MKPLKKLFSFIRITALLFIVIGSSFESNAQADCSNATIICGNTQPVNPSGVGNELEQLACGGVEHNSVWFAFQAQASGKLNFVIRPTTPAGLPTVIDVDWSLWQLAGAPNTTNCNTKTQLSCNFAGSSTVFGIPGATGMASPPFTAAQFNPGINVVSGTWYAIQVDQFSNTTPILLSVQFTDNPESPNLNSTAGIFSNRPNFSINTVSGCSGNYNFVNSSVTTPSITSYLWDFGDGSTSTSANPSHTYLVGGTYYVNLTITNSNGCKTSISKRLIYNDSPPVMSPPSIFVTPACSNSNNGTLTVVTEGITTLGVSGGSPPYTYELVSPSPMIRPSQSSNEFTGLQPGAYTVKVTDACGKSATATTTVSQVATNSSISLGIQNIESSCLGSATGRAVIFASGTKPPYTMAMVDNSPTLVSALTTVQRDPLTATYYGSFTNLLPGTYTVEATDGCGKVRRATFTVLVSTAPTANAVATSSCNGSATGSIAVTATAATGLTANGSPGTFQYALIAPSPMLRPFQNSSGFENLLPGTYTVAVRDICGTIGISTVTVGVAVAPNFGTSFTTISCPNGSTGTIEVQNGTTVGGGGPYSYELIAPSIVTRPSQADNRFSNLPPGSYTVRMTDACGTKATTVLTVGAASAPTFTTAVSASCGASATGSVTVTPGTNAIGPFSFELISPGAAIRVPQPSNIANTPNSIFTGLSQGVYTIRMTDACGVPVTNTATILSPSSLTFPTGSASIPSCSASNTGQITVAQPTTGSAPYQYELISPSPAIRAPQSSRIFNNLPDGDYTIRITDLCGNQVDNSATPLTVNVSTAPALTAANTASCTTASGTITCLAATTNQGGGTYQFALISPSPVTRANQTSPLFISLPAGAYTVQITDQCGVTGTITTTIASAGAFTPAVGGSIVSCNGSGYNGQLIVTNPQNFTSGGPIPTGSGGGPYTYSLYNASNNTQIIAPQASNVFTDVVPVAGNPSHTVRVTDACGNVSTVTAALNPPQNLTAATISAINPSCASSNTGVIKITVQSGGGLAPYTYTLIDAVTSAVVAGPVSGTTFTDVPDNATGYLVRTTDACGNTVVSATALLFAAALTPTVSVVTTPSCVSSSTGRIVATAGAGATLAGGTFSYALYDASNTTQIRGTQTSPVFDNVGAGTYTVRITDRCGSIGTATATVSSTVTPPTATGTVSGTCTGGSNGVITASSTDGSLPITYSLILQSSGAVVAGPQSDNVFSGLAANTYIVRVTDACNTVTNSSSISVVNLSTPPTISTTTALDCDGGSIISGYGGGGSGGPYTYAICSGTACTSFGSFSATSTFTVASSGTYRIAVRDRCGIQTSSADIVVTIPTKATITGITKANVCGATTITVAFTNVPNTPYYSLDGGNFTTTLGSIPVGNHTVRVANNNTGTFGCASNAFSFTVSTTPTAPSTTANVTACSGTSATLTATCVSGTVTWYGSNSTSFLQTGSPYTTTTLSGNTTYNVRCENDGCFGNFAAVNVTVTAAPSATISYAGGTFCRTGSVVSVTQTGTSGGTFSSAPSGLFINSSNGQITPSSSSVNTYTVTYTIAASGGCAAVTTTTSVSITNGPSATISYAGTPFCKTANPINVTSTGSTGGTFSSSPATLTIDANSGQITPSSSTAANYTVTYTIAASGGCAAFTTTTNLSILAPPSATITGTNNLTCTTTSVSRTATGSGTYLWSNGSTSAIVNITSAGIYTLTVTGANGCTATATTNVSVDNSVPNAGISGTNNLSCAVTSVQRTATGSGTYLWSNGSTSAAINIISAGIYTLTVTAANGCTATATTNVSIDNSVPNAGISGTDNLSCTVTSVQRTATGSGTYLWSNGSTSAIVNITSAGIYTLTVTGANGCTATATTNVSVDNSVPNAGISGTNNLSCAVTSVQRTATGSGTYLWSNGSTSAIVNITSAGIYTLTVTGANGCTATATTNVSVDNSVPNAGISGTNNLSCTVTSVQRTATGSGTYLWSNGSTSAIVNFTSAGIYTLTVTGANGCTATATTNVSVDNSVPNAGISGTDNLSCTVTSVQRTATGSGTYLWSNGSTSAIVNITSAGIYTLTVTGANGCTATATTNVSVDNSVPNAGISGTNNLSCAVTSVQRTATGSGTYLWSNGSTSAIVNFTSAGIYTLTVTGANGCTATATTNVSVDNSVPNAGISGTNNLSCTVTSVQRTATGSGTYLWSNGSTSAIVNITSAGIYTLTVTGANGCTATATTNVSVDNSVPNAGISGTNNLSCAVTSVQRTATGSGTYLWSNGSTSAIVNFTSAGIYTLTVTGANGCTATATTNVSVDNSVPNAGISGTNNLSCAVTSVQRTATGSGTYLWSNGSTSAIVNITSAGIYTLTVTGANGCTATATTNVSVDNSVPNAGISGTNNLSCTVTSVQRTATGSGTYLWSNGSTSAIVNITSAGIYTLTVTGANGCTATATTNVSVDNSVPNAGISGTNNLSCTVTSVQRTATGSGTYLWSNGSTSAIVNFTSAGIYTLTVTGANGCTATATTNVSVDNSVPNAGISGTDNLSCTVTSVQRTATGSGTYLWSNGSTSAIVNIISAGIYTLTVTGANGCTATATTNVSVDSSVPNAGISGTDNLSCTVTSVQRTATGSGTYLWSNGSTSAIVNITSAGIYTLTVTGANGCTATATTNVSVDNSVPNAGISGTNNLSCAVTSVQRTATGSGTYLWSNGSTSAIVNITSAGIYTLTVTGANGCTATATTNVSVDNSVPNAGISGTNNLSCTVTSVQRTATGSGTYLWSNGSTSAIVNFTSAGIYTLTVTGANGCTATATTNVSVDNSVPNAGISGTDNLSCTVTSVQRTATGSGTYLWSNGSTSAIVNITSAGIYTLTVTGANGCTATATTNVSVDNSVPNAGISGTNNLSCAVTSVQRTATGSGTYLWSNGSTSAIVNFTSAGIYTLTVTGANGCTATATTNVSVDNSVPNAGISGTNNLSCTVTSVQRTATGSGTYLWSNGSTSAIVNITSAGIYTLTVTGANGCTATATTNVSVDNSVPNAGISGTNNLSCAVTSVQRTATGSGTYLWSNGSTSAIVNFTSAGIYTLTVTGANGCTATATTNVSVDNSVPNAGISGTNNLSCTVTSVQRTATGSGTYLWSNGSTSAIVNITSAGIYTLTVTGANGCTATATTNVSVDNSVPNAGISGTNNLSCTVTSVQRTATGSGTYLWSNGSTSAIVNITSAGIYTLTVTGANGCTATATTNVSVDNSVPNAGISGTNNLSCTVTSVQRTATGSGTYLWSNGSTSAIVNFTSAGIYTLTVTGANGCTATATTNVSVDNSVPNAGISGTDNLSCTVTSVQRTATGSGTYLWSNGSTSAIVNIISAGIYTLTVTGANGCTATATTSITFTNNLNISASNTGPYNIGQSIVLNANGGTSYSWVGPNNFNSTNANPTIPNALTINGGIYTVTATSGICTATATTNVVISGVDPCTQIIDLQYVKAGNPFQPLFSLSNGMTIQQLAEPVSILAVPICQNIPIESVDMTIVGPGQNWTILQNVQLFALFDNLGTDIFGRNLIPGTYTITITGYAQDNRGGGIVYGPVNTTFTIVGNLATISAPTITNSTLCAGSSVDVTFSTTGTFNPSNNFQIQLSDENGNFSNPTIIGTSSTSGTITCQIPQTTVGGGNYRIRVTSSNQVLAGNPTVSVISVIPAAKTLTSDVTGTLTEQASQTITASNKVIAPANVTYQAGKAIELTAGFVANSGTIFKAEIRGCSN